MTNDSGLFHSERTPNRITLLEAKMLHHFDHRFSTYAGASQEQLTMGTLPRTTAEQKAMPNFAITPRYWVERADVDERLVRRNREGNVIWEWRHDWLLGFRHITNTTNERTVIASLLPRVGIGNSM